MCPYYRGVLLNRRPFSVLGHTLQALQQLAVNDEIIKVSLN